MEQSINKTGLKVKQEGNYISIHFDDRYVGTVSLSRYNSGKMFGTVCIWDVESRKSMRTKSGQKGVYLRIEQQ